MQAHILKQFELSVLFVWQLCQIQWNNGLIDKHLFPFFHFILWEIKPKSDKKKNKEKKSVKKCNIK